MEAETIFFMMQHLIENRVKGIYCDIMCFLIHLIRSPHPEFRRRLHNYSFAIPRSMQRRFCSAKRFGGDNRRSRYRTR